MNEQRYEVREVREYYKKTGDIDKTLRDLPRYLVAERSMVSLFIWVVCLLMLI